MLVNGLGGVGKTEVCREYVWDNYDRFGHLSWIDYQASLKESFVTQFQIEDIFTSEDKSLDKRFAKIVNYICNLDSNSLLIIDNIDDPEDADLSVIRSLPFKVIANSRLSLSGFDIYPLGYLSQDRCKDLFMKNYQGKPDAAALSQIINLAGQHTLSVELLAKTASSADLSIVELLQKLKKVGFNLSQAIPEKVRSDWHAQVDKQTFFEHLNKVFDLSNVNQDEKHILANLSVLPAVYVERKDLSQWLNLKIKNALNSLVEKGWLKQQGSQVLCHQIIQEVVKHSLKPDIKTCEKLVVGLAGQLHWGPKDNPVTKQNYVIFGQSVLESLNVENVNIAILANNVATIYRFFAQYPEAEPLYRRALKIRENQLGPDHPDVAQSLNNLALLLKAQGKYPEAEPLYRRALKIRENQLGPDHPDVATSLNNLASLLHAQGKYPEARPLYSRALEIYEKQLGADHHNVATSLNNLAALLCAQGKHPEAEPLYRHALEIYENQLGPDHPDVATSLNNLAVLINDQGKYPEAEPLYRRALEIRENQLGLYHPYVAQSLNNLAELLRAQGKHPEAEPLYRRALEIYENQLGPDHSDVAQSLNNLAFLLKAQGKYHEAEPLYRRALEIYENQLGPDHPHLATSLNNLAELLRAQGKHSEAEPLYRRALEIYENQLGPDHPHTKTARDNLEKLLKTKNNQ